MSDDFMTIREMCDSFDVTPRALRYYESLELLAPQRDGQKRLYSARERARLKLILRGRRFGFSLEEIRILLDLYEPAGPNLTQLREVHDAALVRLEKLEEQRQELDDTIADLRGQIEWGSRKLQELD